MPRVIPFRSDLNAEREKLPRGIGYRLPVNFLIEEISPSAHHLSERNDARGEIENFQNLYFANSANHENRERARGESAVNGKSAVSYVDYRKERVFGVYKRFNVENNVPEPCSYDTAWNDGYHYIQKKIGIFALALEHRRGDKTAQNHSRNDTDRVEIYRKTTYLYMVGMKFTVE